MQSLRQSILFLLLCGATAAAEGAAPAASLHSFADLYRLSVGAEYAVTQATPQGVAVSYSVAAADPAAYVFSIGAIPGPHRGLLLLSGLALAAWVARRRLGYSL